MAIGEKLGPSWSEDDLSEIALLLDVSPQDAAIAAGRWRERLGAPT